MQDLLSISRGYRCLVLGLAFGFGLVLPGISAPALPAVQIAGGHTLITQSCRISIPAGLILPDGDGTGVIQVGAPNIEIEFAPDSRLRGCAIDIPPDHYQGYAICVNGHKGVTIRGANISGYWCGVYATNTDRLLLEDIDASDNHRARLKSTPASEDESDWLYGHDNDQREWLTRYAAAIYLARSSGVIIRNCRVWHGQNALCLDRITASKIYDNDFSFNSGWGIALWRCSSNIISRNALDFCVRGYSHGVYNRGQDSAGIFAFEQNNGNVFAENSVTHGGDGFFGFAGREALGEAGDHPVEWYQGRGNSNNLLIRNDFSDAAAHGIENTFSFGNRYLANRICGNAICGIWAGYSRQTLIADNDIQTNGERGYGLERGGINIDHGGDNLVVSNRFSGNKCGVHLWGGPNPDFEKKKWAQANGYASTGSVVAGNLFNGDELAFQFRGAGDVTLGSNTLVGVTKEMLDDPAYLIHRATLAALPGTNLDSELVVPGQKHPVGVLAALRGRENIIMTEWGPWDHQSPLVRLLKSSGPAAVYQVLKVPSLSLKVETAGTGVTSRIEPIPGRLDETTISVGAKESGVHPYHLNIESKGKRLAELDGTLMAAEWKVTFFKWPADIDPRSDLNNYRRLATGPGAVSDVLPELSFKYGMRGPSDLGLSTEITKARLGRDHFGMVARAHFPLARGTWKFSTESDDGVRVSVDGKPVIENWTWHGPTRDSGSVTLESERTVEVVVEHFQIDGYSVLDFSVAPVRD